MTTTPAPPSREAEIAARLERIPSLHIADVAQLRDDCRYLLAELQQARQERDEWKAILDPLMVQVNQTWRDRAEQAEAALQQAREVLTHYGQHDGGCKKLSRLAPSDGSWPCTCGLDTALKAVR